MTWYEMCKLHMQRKLCRPLHNIQKRADIVRQSKQKSELAYTSKYKLNDTPPQARPHESNVSAFQHVLQSRFEQWALPPALRLQQRLGCVKMHFLLCI